MGSLSLFRDQSNQRVALSTLPSSADIKESVELYHYFHLWVFMACRRSNLTSVGRV